MDDFLKTRRSFLKTGLWGASASWTVPMFLEGTMRQMEAATKDLAVQADTGKDREILVVLQLAGGNDGLNTLVPVGNDLYEKARPRLKKGKGDVKMLNDDLGLNNSLEFMGSLYDEGDLAIVQGVGYPNPNRSHFVSTSIWETCDTNNRSNTGWLGRYFDNSCTGSDPTVGISLKKNQPESFGANKNPGISLSAPELYRWIHGGDQAEAAEKVFADLNQPDEAMMVGEQAREINGTKTGAKAGESNLAFLERVALDAQVSSKDIVEIARKHTTQVQYPAFQLARSLSLVSRMIAGGMGTRVYYVSHGGFDTHRGQAGNHDRLLDQLDGSLKAFFADLKQQGNYDRVTVMTFSEFGRRVAENASAGTDHGKASCLFVAGGGVKGGLYGKYPDLADLHAGDLQHTVDFRSVYATVVEDWLKGNSQPVVGGNYKKLGFIG